jgi:hypothetical protein
MDLVPRLDVRAGHLHASRLGVRGYEGEGGWVEGIEGVWMMKGVVTLGCLSAPHPARYILGMFVYRINVCFCGFARFDS